MVSFIIYFHSARTDNLEQTLRFLAKREHELLAKCELILVCQDYIEEIKDYGFQSQKLLNLELPVFNKAIMCNRAVKEANGEILVLLDCDRVLSVGYFTREIATLKDKEITSARKLYKIESPSTDEQIERNILRKKPDYRYVDEENFGNNISTKGMFSGNTILKKKDFLEIGGMDESFENYGFSDTDFMFTAHKNELTFKLVDEEELHLWHPAPMEWQDFLAINTQNAFKFCKKWNIEPPKTWTKLHAIWNNKPLFL